MVFFNFLSKNDRNQLILIKIRSILIEIRLKLDQNHDHGYDLVVEIQIWTEIDDQLWIPNSNWRWRFDLGGLITLAYQNGYFPYSSFFIFVGPLTFLQLKLSFSITCNKFLSYLQMQMFTNEKLEELVFVWVVTKDGPFLIKLNLPCSIEWSVLLVFEIWLKVCQKKYSVFGNKQIPLQPAIKDKHILFDWNWNLS